jgi:hypothetical protein
VLGSIAQSVVVGRLTPKQRGVSGSSANCKRMVLGSASVMAVTDDIDKVQHRFEPDAALMREHLERLFRRCPEEYPGGLIEIAWSDRTGAITKAFTFPSDAGGIDSAITTQSHLAIGFPPT